MISSFFRNEIRALAACDIESPPAIFSEAKLPFTGSEKSIESDRDFPNIGQTIGVKFPDVKANPENYVGAAYLQD
ncbi:MAG: hypothetical protein IPP07_02005 [Holophagales bacterium]|nr:hypothetical protein [Holophagales bacterium]